MECTAFDLQAKGFIDRIIEEAEQPWYLGTMPVAYMNFTVQPTTIYDGTEERIWGTVTKPTPTKTVKNGKMIADLEYFLMGERGDQYRNINWPNSIPTTYLADPNSEYHIFDVHYAYVGSNEGVQKSEKTISIVCADKTAMNSIITAFNTATGLSVAALA